MLSFCEGLVTFSGVTTGSTDPAMQRGPRTYGGPKLWH